MRFYAHYSTGSYIDADSPESAQEQLCELIVDNLDPSEIEVDPCEDDDESEDEVPEGDSE